MPDLNEIQVFTKVAQAGSFSKAAKILGMPVSTVSRKVADLEKRLGLTLIQRTTRKLSLTQTGEIYFNECASALLGLEQAEANALGAQAEPSGLLRVTGPVELGMSPFMEFVDELIKKYPKLKFDFVFTNQFVDLIEEGIDVALRFGQLNDSTLIARPLGESRRIFVASPEYLKKHGTPTHPKQLVEHQCLTYSGRSSDSLWEIAGPKGRIKVNVSGPISTNTMLSLREAAVRGLGIAFLPTVHWMEDIRDCRLKHILKDWASPGSPVSAVYPKRKFNPAKLTVFLDELAKWKKPVWGVY